MKKKPSSKIPKPVRPRDLKYRYLIEGLTDDPRLLDAARWIDETILREQGCSQNEARDIINK
jgi:hypothetical protein